MAISGKNLLKGILTYRRLRTAWTSHCISCPISKWSMSTPPYDMSKFVRDLGYPIETHENLKTDDGYFLTMYRIPHGKNKTIKSKKGPVLLMHDFGCSGFHWVSGGTQHSYAFLLADDGYDVWIGNARGTPYSKKHAHYDPEEDPEKFWDFSWHEIGYYDLHTKINHIVKTTQQQQIIYIGHGQGTTSFFVLMSTRSEMNRKVKLLVGFAPVVYTPKEFVIKSESLALDIFHQIDSFRRLMGIHTIGPQIRDVICSPFSTQSLCGNFSNMLLSLSAIDSSKISPEHYQLLSQTFPALAAAKQFLHSFQITITGEFMQYYLGENANLQKFRSDTPPKYHVTRTKSPVLLFVGDKDTSTHLKGAQKIAALVPNDVDLQVVPNTNHMDFLFAGDSVNYVYSKMLPIFNNYPNSQ